MNDAARFSTRERILARTVTGGLAHGVAGVLDWLQFASTMAGGAVRRLAGRRRRAHA